MGQLGAAEPAHDLLVGRVPVIHHDVVIGALLVRLKLKLGEEQLYPVARSGGEYPDTFLNRSRVFSLHYSLMLLRQTFLAG